MRVVITDEQALRALSWKAVKAYLEASGWHCDRTVADKGVIYQHTAKGGRLSEIAVLTRDDLADYAARMGDAVGTLARVEDRSELDVYEDLRAIGARLAASADENAEPPPPVDETTRAVHERIKKWLAEENWHVRDVKDPQASFNIMATPQSGANVNIFQYRDHLDHITLSQRCVFDEQSRSEISRLPISAQREVVYHIYRDISIIGLDLSGLTVPSNEMTIRTYIYFDGLTKDTLMYRIRLTIRALSLALETFVMALEESIHSVQGEEASHPTEQATNEEPTHSMGLEEAEPPIEQTTDLKAGYSVEVKEADDPEEKASNIVAFRSRAKLPDGEDESRTKAS